MFDLPDFGMVASFGLFFFISFFKGLQKYLKNVYFIFNRDHNAHDITTPIQFDLIISVINSDRGLV